MVGSDALAGPETRGAAATLAGVFSAQDAAFLLGGVSQARRRMDDVRHRTWVLPAVLGVALISGSEVARPIVGIRYAPSCSAAAAAGSCVVGTSVRSELAAPLWSVGSTAFFWMGAVAVSLVIMGLVRWRHSPRGRFWAVSVAAAVAAAALGVDAAMRLDPLVAPLANITAIGLAIATVVVVDRSRGLAIIGALFLLTSLALSHALPDVVLPGSTAYLPGTSVMQAVVGVVLLATSLGLRRWPGVLPARLLPAFVRNFAVVAG